MKGWFTLKIPVIKKINPRTENNAHIHFDGTWWASFCYKIPV
jgi:hypothetical protein